MATGFCFILTLMHTPSHCFSCGQTRPQTAGRLLVFLMVLMASSKFSRSMFLMNVGILMPTGQPFIQLGSAQSRQRFASSTACSRLRPCCTSSVKVVTRYSGVSSGILTRSMAPRSFGDIDLRNSSRHGSLRRAFISSSVIINLFWVLKGSKGLRGSKGNGTFNPFQIFSEHFRTILNHSEPYSLPQSLRHDRRAYATSSRRSSLRQHRTRDHRHKRTWSFHQR